MKLTHDELTAKGFVLGQTGYSKMPTAKQIGEATISDAGPKVLGTKAKRIRQRTKPLLNKLETEFWETLLLFRFPRYTVRTQSETFTLANGVRYTPDMTCTWLADGDQSLWCKHAYEVKGPQQCQDDAVVKLKVAAKMYPEIGWFLVWKDKATGEWREQRILSE